MRDDTKAIAAFFGLVFLVITVLLIPFVVSVFAPCSWLGWMSVKDAPVRCLPHGEVK